MNRIALPFYCLTLSLAVATLGCLSSVTREDEIQIEDPDTAGSTEIRDGSGLISTGPLTLRCASQVPYLNTPFTLNDGSMKYVPTGVTGGIVPAGSGATQPILAPMGSTLTSITVRIAPAVHTSLDDELLPYLEFRKVGRNGVETKIGGIAWDPYAIPYSVYNPGAEKAAAFSQPHDIVMPLNEVVGDSYYYIIFAQEWGGGQAKNGWVCGTTLTVTPSSN